MASIARDVYITSRAKKDEIIEVSPGRIATAALYTPRDVPLLLLSVRDHPFY